MKAKLLQRVAYTTHEEDNPEWMYHSTSWGNLPEIAKAGLVPNPSGALAWPEYDDEDIEAGLPEASEPRIYFTSDLDGASEWGGRTPVTLRVNTRNLSELETGGPYREYFYTTHPIPPSNLEVLKDGEWVPLSISTPKQAGTTPETLWNDKHVVGEWRGEYKLVVNNPSDPTYITVWTNDNKKAGFLEAREYTGKMREYIGIRSVEVAPQYRGQRLGLALYKTLLATLPARYKGICSYLPDRANKRQVPAIWRTLGGRVSPESEDYIVVDR